MRSSICALAFAVAIHSADAWSLSAREAASHEVDGRQLQASSCDSCDGSCDSSCDTLAWGCDSGCDHGCDGSCDSGCTGSCPSGQVASADCQSSGSGKGQSRESGPRDAGIAVEL